MRHLWGKVPRGLIILGLLVVGGFLIWLPYVLPWPGLHGLSKGLGEALVVFALLAFTIERWFRQEFAEDVFHAGLGAALRPEFRDELHWITSFDWLSFECRCRVKLERIGDDIVRFTLEISRKTENISAAPKKYSAKIAVDEWGIPGHASVIERCGLVAPDGTVVNGSLDKKSSPSHPGWTTKEISVDPKLVVKTSSKSIEYRHATAIHCLALVYPTKDPEVELEVDPTLEAEVSFTHRGPANAEPLVGGKTTLRGTLLPSQLILFQWRPKRSQAQGRLAGASG